MLLPRLVVSCAALSHGQGSAQRLGHAFETVQSADGSEHMRGVGALPAPGTEQLQVTAHRQKGVEQMLFRASGDETAAELAQNRSLDARVGQANRSLVKTVAAILSVLILA